MGLIVDINIYKSQYLPRLLEIKKFYEDMSLHDAIKNASEGRNPNGKMNSHQCRIGMKKCSIAAKTLMEQEVEIENCNTFEELFQIMEGVKKQYFRLGDLWSYDTALRIGFNLRKYPKEVYIQAGVIKGAKKALKKDYYCARHIPLSHFPKEILKLKPFEVENFLCIWGKKNKKTNC